jgi:hypothetical protein
MKDFGLRQNKTNGKGWGKGYTQGTMNRRSKDTRNTLSNFFHNLGDRFDRKGS